MNRGKYKNNKNKKKTNKNATSHFVSVLLSFFFTIRRHIRKKTQSFVWKVPFAFTLWFSLCKGECFIFGCFFCFFQALNSSVWNKTVDIHLLQRMRLVIHKLAVRPPQTHKRPICGAIITSTTTSPDKTIRPSVL